MTTMKPVMLLTTISVLLCGFTFNSARAAQPHIVFIVADDLGWNDVSFHGSDQIQTPNIDALAYNGVILNSHYVLPLCTPTRSSLMTGKYAMHLGMQGTPLLAPDVRSLPAGKLLPQYLKELGYSTRMVGKWHVGHSHVNDTPTYRGFDSHLGYLLGFTSYYDYILSEELDGKVYHGMTMKRGLEPAWDLVGQYATDMFTDEAVEIINEHDQGKPLFLYMAHVGVHTGNEGKWLEAPQDAVDNFRHIINPNRRTYAGMVAKVDESVGRVVKALQSRGMLENSIIVFISDNGAPSVGYYRNWGSNWPLRGIKGTLWEGGIRGVACVWSPQLTQTPRISNEMMHVTDWLPTLYSAAGGDVTELDPDVDGIDLWPSIVYNFPSPRSEILLNIEETTKNAALRYNNWKLIIGSSGNPESELYQGESGKVNVYTLPYNMSAVAQSMVGDALAKSLIATPSYEFEALRREATVKCLNNNENKNPPTCDPSTGVSCLYDISSDPCEEHDVSKLFPYIVRRMKKALVEYRAGLIPQQDRTDAAAADPKNFNYTWTPWID